MKAFEEFERRFARLPEREQRLVGEDKVMLFVKPSGTGGHRN